MRRYSQQYGFFLESDINVLPSFQATGLTGIKFLLSWKYYEKNEYVFYFDFYPSTVQEK